MHRTHMGDDQDPAHILKGAIRTALSDGWDGSMWATEANLAETGDANRVNLRTERPSLDPKLVV